MGKRKQCGRARHGHVHQSQTDPICPSCGKPWSGHPGATKLCGENNRLKPIVEAALKLRNVSRGWMAEDRTKELPNVAPEEVEAYEAELTLKLFKLLDAYEEKS